MVSKDEIPKKKKSVAASEGKGLCRVYSGRKYLYLKMRRQERTQDRLELNICISSLYRTLAKIVHNVVTGRSRTLFTKVPSYEFAPNDLKY